MPATTTTATSDSSMTTTLSSSAALESDLLNHLANTSALEDLHANLLSSLQRAGWTERVRNLSLELLRAGRCDHFDDVLEAVVALAEGRSHPAVTPAEDGATNGEATRDPDVDAFFENIDVRIPKSVVEQGVKAIKDALRPIVVIEDDGDATDGVDGAGQQQPEGSTSASTSAKKERHPGGKAGKDTGSGSHRKGTTDNNKDKSSRPSMKNGDTSPSKKPAKKAKTGGKDVKTSS
jgi:hypothetical protein